VPEQHGEVFWRSRRWWNRAGQTVVGAWVANGLALVATVVAARALGPEEYGAVVLAIGVVMLVSIFLDVTLEEATVFYGNRALVSGDLAGLRALLGKSLKVDVGVGVIVSTAIAVLAAPLAEVASGGWLDSTLVRIAAVSVLVTTADSTAFAVLGLARRVELRAWSRAAASAFRLVGVTIAVQLGGAEAVVVSHAMGGAAGSVVLGFWAWRVGWRKWDPGGPRGASPASDWELARYGFHTSLTTTVQSVYGTLVPVLLARATGPAAVGIFRVAMLPLTISGTLGAPIRLAMFPEQARLVAERRPDEVRRSTKGYTLIAFALGSVGAVGLWFAMPWLIPLVYSSSFEGAVTPARILLVAAVFGFALTWRKTLLAAVGRPEIRTRLETVQLVVMATLLLVLADRGAEGAAIAVSAGTVAGQVTWLFIARGLLTDESLLAVHQARSSPGPRRRGRRREVPAGET
jgi:O-antigen/teichoic acid export membrane protein